MRSCRDCDNATSGDCGGHGSVVISLPQVNVTLNQEGLAQMIARAVVALESIAASMRPTITVGHAEPPSVCAGSGQPAHGLPLDATACGVICPMCGADVACGPAMQMVTHPWREPTKEQS